MDKMNKTIGISHKREECEKFVCDWVSDFLEKNWDKIDHKRCEINGTKENFLKEVKSDIQTAMWVITEVMWWGMDKDYYSDIHEYEPEDCEFRVIKLNDAYIRFFYHTASARYSVSFVEPKTKTVIYFE